MATRFVGKIVLQSSDGRPHLTAQYAVPMVLREAEIFAPDGVYRQNHQLDDSTWVYRWHRDRGDRPVDPFLGDYRPTGPNGEEQVEN